MTETTGRVLERRMFATEFRDVKGSNGRQKWATAVTYNRVDDFGTIWLPSCFNQGLDERMPTILYGHDWYTLDHVLGQGVDYKDNPSGVDVLIEFADPDLVPPAARAIALTSGPKPILKDVSVGFDRQEWLRKDDLDKAQLEQGAEEAMVRAVMDELSIVVRGAVPDAQMRTRRSFVIDGTVTAELPQSTEPITGSARMVNIRGQLVDIDTVVDLAKKRAAGELTMEEARATLELVGDAPSPTGVNVFNVPEGSEPKDVYARHQAAQLEQRMTDLYSSDQASMLRDALEDRFQPGPDRYIWVVDFTDVQVVFEKYGFDDAGLFMLPYSIDGDLLTLDPGDEVEVQRVTSYVPDPDSGGGSGNGGGTAPAPPVEERSVPSDADIDAALATAGRGRR